MRKSTAILAASSALSWSGTLAARTCAPGAQFLWNIGDIRYDGADKSKNGAKSATFAASVMPRGGTMQECVAEWPETWAGWYDGGSDIIWSDCIWTGAGGRLDKSISFAVDWKAKTLYLAHTYDCARETGYDNPETAT